LSKLHHHMEVEHNDHKCEYCEFATGYPISLSNHKMIKHGRRLVYCDQCSYSTAFSRSLKSHIEKNHVEKNHVEKNHVEKEHTEKVTKELRGNIGKYFLCDQCSYSTSKLYQLKCHIRKIHTGDISFACTECDVVYKTEQALAVHRKSAIANGNKYSCEVCDAIFCLKINLDRHTRDKHLKLERGIKCDECDGVFLDNNGILIHKNAAHNKYKCEKCNYTADRLDLVDQHMLVQHKPMNKKRWRPRRTCPFCGHNKSKSPGELRNHIKYHHENVAPQYKCDECDTAFNNRSAKNAHMRKAAKTDGVKHPCEACGKVFCLEGYLKYHRKKEHFVGEKPISCDICEKGFYKKDILKRHQIRKHKVYENHAITE